MREIGTSAYELELPPTMPVHPVFHTGLLKPWNAQTRAYPPPQPIIVDGVEEHEVKAIVAHKYARRGKARTLKYLVKWRGHSEIHNSWEPAIALTDCVALDVYKSGRNMVDEENAHTGT